MEKFKQEYKGKWFYKLSMIVYLIQIFFTCKDQFYFSFKCLIFQFSSRQSLCDPSFLFSVHFIVFIQQISSSRMLVSINTSQNLWFPLLFLKWNFYLGIKNIFIWILCVWSFWFSEELCFGEWIQDALFLWGSSIWNQS